MTFKHYDFNNLNSVLTDLEHYIYFSVSQKKLLSCYKKIKTIN